MIENNLANLYNAYVNELSLQYLLMHHIELDEQDDIIYDKKFLEYVQNNLEHVGFTPEEASGITTNSFKNKDVMYRVIALCYKSKEWFDSEETLREIIKASPLTKAEDYIEEDIKNIFDASKRIYI